MEQQQRRRRQRQWQQWQQFVNRLAIRHQYVNWFPTACNNAAAIGMFQNMMCHAGSILECRTTANPYIA